jgi:hypothetical protein
MFAGCISLTKSPILPATTLDAFCYLSMFNACSKLITAPELPATTLANGCYYNMFYDCKSLTEAPILPATTLAVSCYESMFAGCISLKQTQGALNATKPKPFCYRSMFAGCSSLEEAPNIELTTVNDNCLDYMFSGCTSLTYIAVEFHFDGKSWSITKWVEGVTSKGIFKKPKALLAKYGINNIPENFQCSVNVSGGNSGGASVSTPLTFQLITESPSNEKSIESPKLLLSYSQENDETTIPKYNKPFTISNASKESMYVAFKSDSSSKAKLVDNFLYRIL